MPIPRNDALRPRVRLSVAQKSLATSKLASTPTDAETIRTQAISPTLLSDGQTYVMRGGVMTPETLPSGGGGGGGGAITVRELDGSPLDSGVTMLRVPNGTLVSNSGGDMTVNYAGVGIQNSFTQVQTFQAGLTLGVSQAIKDSGGTNRILLTTSAPHINVTGDVAVTGTVEGLVATTVPAGQSAAFLFDSQIAVVSGDTLNGVKLQPSVNGPGSGTWSMLGVFGQMTAAPGASDTGVIITALDFQATVSDSNMGTGTAATVSSMAGIDVKTNLTGQQASGAARTITITSMYGLRTRHTIIATGSGINVFSVTTLTEIDVPGVTTTDTDITVASWFGININGSGNAMSRVTTRKAIFEGGTGAAGDTHGNFLRSNTQHGSTTGSFGGGDGVIGLRNATTAPTTDPTNGGVLYAEAGALKWRGSGGTVTTIAAA